MWVGGIVDQPAQNNYRRSGISVCNFYPRVIAICLLVSNAGGKRGGYGEIYQGIGYHQGPLSGGSLVAHLMSGAIKGLVEGFK